MENNAKGGDRIVELRRVFMATMTNTEYRTESRCLQRLVEAVREAIAAERGCEPDDVPDEDISREHQHRFFQVPLEDGNRLVFAEDDIGGEEIDASDKAALRELFEAKLRLMSEAPQARMSGSRFWRGTKSATAKKTSSGWRERPLSATTKTAVERSRVLARWKIPVSKIGVYDVSHLTELQEAMLDYELGFVPWKASEAIAA